MLLSVGRGGGSGMVLPIGLLLAFPTLLLLLPAGPLVPRRREGGTVRIEEREREREREREGGVVITHFLPE